MDDLLVQVNFDLRCQGEKKSLTVEMDGNQLDSLIDTLENINKVSPLLLAKANFVFLT